MPSRSSADHSAVAKARPAWRWLLALACGCIALGSGKLQAQTVYRIVGPDGRVTFSDKPAATPASKVTPVDNVLPASEPADPVLPYALRQLVAKYPVTLYSSSDCAPCDSARKLLTARGVPFSEKTIGTARDALALRTLSGNNAVPFLTIGAQHLLGFSVSEWTQYLNAAGYPQSSTLPANYRPSPAVPLAPLETPAAPASAPEPAAPALPVIPATNTGPGNPAGIRF